MVQTALILGSSGRFGRNMAQAFGAAGWRVRNFNRETDTLSRAAQGADVIVHGWNPPYDRWDAEVMDLTAQVITAARLSGATVLIPGNVYVYGVDAPEIFAEDTPHAAQNRLGRIRTRMEQAFADSGVQTILLRAGDFLDTQASGNWFDRIIAAKLAKGRFSYPGALDAPHAWAFLPDLARAFVMLAEKRAQLPVWTSLNFEGYTLTGREMAALLGAAPARMNWLPIQLIAPFWKMGRCILEMRYLWDKPHRLASARFDELLPDFRPTPVADALAQAASFQIDPDKMVVRGGALARA